MGLPKLVATKEQRDASEKLWVLGGGHFKYFRYECSAGRYIPTGVRDHLTDADLVSASITLNTSYLFYLGGWKQATLRSGAKPC